MTVCSHLTFLEVEIFLNNALVESIKNQTSLENEVFKVYPLQNENEQIEFAKNYVMSDEEVYEFSLAVKNTLPDFSIFNLLPGKKIIFTDNISFTVERFFDNWNINMEDYFDGIFDMYSGNCITKKEVSAFKIFEKSYEVPSEKCILIDDSTTNIEVAKKAGWQAIQTTYDPKGKLIHIKDKFIK